MGRQRMAWARWSERQSASFERVETLPRQRSPDNAPRVFRLDKSVAERRDTEVYSKRASSEKWLQGVQLCARWTRNFNSCLWYLRLAAERDQGMQSFSIMTGTRPCACAGVLTHANLTHGIVQRAVSIPLFTAHATSVQHSQGCRRLRALRDVNCIAWNKSQHAICPLSPPRTERGGFSCTYSAFSSQLTSLPGSLEAIR